MEQDTRSEMDIDAVCSEKCNGQVASSPKDCFRFLALPRELRDLIYDYTLRVPDTRSVRALRIERRNLKYFQPSAAAILLVLHHEYFLLNRQVAREALQVLLKNHTVFLSCGPFVLKSILSKIEEQNGPGRRWLGWIKSIELDWVTFPNLTHYPPDREGGRDEWYWENEEEYGNAGGNESGHDHEEVDVDYLRGAAYNGHYDEYDHEGGHYDDNFYDPADSSLYPAFHPPAARNMPTNANAPPDPFGFASHYPFTDPSHPPAEDQPLASPDDIASKLTQLVAMEVTPLFTYLASPTFALESLTIPLYFISRESFHHRNLTRPGYALPLKIRYWVHVCVHALMMLQPLPSALPTPSLRQVKVRYLPWDVWASMDPADDLRRVVEQGVWFDEKGAQAVEREGEGEAFRAVWAGLRDMGYKGRMQLHADVKYVKWDGNVDSWRVGDELEVVFRREENRHGKSL
ncbi:hypothetical protein DE146DRAFT_311019 [Phaeosphaeria sp. MPI-PUGE-AT-0046c]|nr:hypothetical protein DE146DRAFT_311019 [Phaeosphaeria sp. MPI-PUGE-AT-0046c]